MRDALALPLALWSLYWYYWRKAAFVMVVAHLFAYTGLFHYLDLRERVARCEAPLTDAELEELDRLLGVGEGA